MGRATPVSSSTRPGLPAAVALVVAVGACSFPDVFTGEEVGLTSGTPSGATGETTGSTPSSGASPTTGAGGAAPAGGGGATSTGDVTSSTASGPGGGGGEGGGPGTGASAGGGGAGGDPSPGSGGGSGSTTTSSSTGGGTCPAGCEICGDDCPEDATPDDCDADGDPDEGAAPDCHRCNDRVRHGQSTYFVDPYQRIGGGTSYDYDCNGSADRDFPNDEAGCGAFLGACASSRVYPQAEAPPCGQTATFEPCTYVAILGCQGGDPDDAIVACK